MEAVHAHAVEIGERVGRSSDVRSVVLDYPLLLLSAYQPIIVPGALGLVALLRRRPPDGAVLLLVWVILPVLLYSTSAVGAPRYLHPLLPALALLAGQWLRRTLPAVAQVLTTRIVLAVALTAAVIFFMAPAMLTRDMNAPFKRYAASTSSSAGPIPYLGARYWEIANPLLYYTERTLAPEQTPAAALAAAQSHPERLLLCDRDRLAEIEVIAPQTRTVTQGARWVLLEM